MRSVYRFEVPVDDKDHEHALTGRLVAVNLRRSGVVEFWAIHSDRDPATKYSFRVIGTGHPVPAGYGYCGTALDGGFVWHLFASEVPS